MKLVTLMIILLHGIKCYYAHVENTAIWVSRRYSLDLYFSRESGKPQLSVSFEVCYDNRPTYMVEERQCVRNEDFFDGNWCNDY